MGINATLELSKSDNAKVVVIGNPKDGLPIIGAIPMDSDIGKSKRVKLPQIPEKNPKAVSPGSDRKEVSPENKAEESPSKLPQAAEKTGNAALPESKKESSQK